MNIRNFKLFFSLPAALALAVSLPFSGCDLQTNALDGTQAEGLLMGRSLWSNIGYYDAPEIKSFRSTYSSILTRGADFSSSSLNVELNNLRPERFKYSFEILEGDGELSGPDNARGKVFHAGATPGPIRIQVTLTNALDDKIAGKAELNLHVLNQGSALLTAPSGDGDSAGQALTALGDVDGDGVADLAMGAPGDPDGGADSGALWILFLNPDHSVKKRQKISNNTGNFPGTIGRGDKFGFSLANMGDLDGDGVNELAVGAPWNDDAAVDQGCLWILFLNRDGTVKSANQLTSTNQYELAHLNASAAHLGFSLGNAGDVDGDGINDLAVGLSDSGRVSERIYILFLARDGTLQLYDTRIRVITHLVLSKDSSFLNSAYFSGDSFGDSVTGIPDLDGDGVGELVIGARSDDTGATDRGAVHIIFLRRDPNAPVKYHTKITGFQDGFLGGLFEGDNFGASITSLGDINGDGLSDIAVGAPGDEDGGADRGAVWILNLTSDGKVAGQQKISANAGNFAGSLGNGDGFGSALAGAGDLDGDGVFELFVGAPGRDGDGTDRGAAWRVLLQPDGRVIH